MKDDPQAMGVLEGPTDSVGIPKLTGHVLVVDDVRDNCRLFATFLRMVGARTSLAENGRVAYDKVMAAWESGQPFDLVLMDLEMPVLDGIATTQRLREAGYAETIVMHAADDVNSRRKMCFTAGCDDYFEKPIGREDLFALLTKYLPSRSSGPEQP